MTTMGTRQRSVPATAAGRKPVAAGPLPVVAVLGLLLSGCQFTNSAISEQAFQPSRNPITIETAEKNDRLAEIARTQHPRILATYGGEYQNAKLERMVAKVVGQLTGISGGPAQTYRITILNSPNVNAFALPGGYLYVTRGLLALANDSAELAAVIAHEMGHVTANHGIERQRKEAEEELATRVVSDVLGNDRKARTALVRGKLRLAQFSRNQELEADVIGIKAMGEAGFDTYAAPRFLQSMAAYSDFRAVSGADDASLDFLATHPAAPRRIELAMRHARQFGSPNSGNRDRDSYLAGIDGIVFGDTPDEGYVRGRTFLHPGLGVAFSVPAGFVIDNSADAVTAAGPGDIAVRFDAVAVSKRTKATDYIRSGWVVGLDEASIRPVTVNGLEGANARARADGWKFDITAVRVGDQIYRLLTAAPLSSQKLEEVAGGVSASFRRMGEAERANLKPLTVKVVTVKPGDTIASIAGQMAGTDRKLGLFRLLNALPAGAAVSAGDKVKIITDR
ncbi:MAG: M48 family metalloprotease [Rhizobiaceae bacterium]